MEHEPNGQLHPDDKSKNSQELDTLNIAEHSPEDMKEYGSDVFEQIELIRKMRAEFSQRRSFYNAVIEESLDTIERLLEEEQEYLLNPQRGLEPKLNKKALEKFRRVSSSLDQSIIHE